MWILQVARTALTASTATALWLATGCSTTAKSPQKATAMQAAVDSDSVVTDSILAALSKPKTPVVPKVPFNDQPCLSLSQADLVASWMLQVFIGLSLVQSSASSRPARFGRRTARGPTAGC